MADGGLLVPPSQDPNKEKIWAETRKRLERFLPELFLEIFPDASLSTQDKFKSPPTSTVASPTVPLWQGANDEPAKEYNNNHNSQSVPTPGPDVAAGKGEGED